MFEISSLSNSVETSPIIWIVFASLMTLLLSTLLVITYDKTSQKVARPEHFVQSLLLMSLVTCTIMQSIGDSIALGFGIFGALAIIRFRTRISDPRDVAFVFATMAVGIACGVHSFVNGAIGTVMFCIIVIILRFTPFGTKQQLVGNLRVFVEGDDEAISPVMAILQSHTSDYAIKRIRTMQVIEEVSGTEYEFNLVLQTNATITDFISDLKSSPNTKVLKLQFEDENNNDNT